MKDIEGLYRISTNLLRAMLPKWQVVPIMNTALNIQTIIEVDRRAGLQIQEETNLVNLNISRNQPKYVWWVFWSFWSFWSFLFQGTAVQHTQFWPLLAVRKGNQPGALAEKPTKIWGIHAHIGKLHEILRLPCPRCRKCTDSPVGWTDLQGYTCQDRSSNVGSEKLRLRQPESVFFLNVLILWYTHSWHAHMMQQETSISYLWSGCEVQLGDGVKGFRMITWEVRGGKHSPWQVVYHYG